MPRFGRRLIPAKAGIGLRFPHHQTLADTRPDVAWLEVHTENYMGGGASSLSRYIGAGARGRPGQCPATDAAAL